MAKPRTGYVLKINGRWCAQLSYTDSLGKRRYITRSAKNKSEAKLLLTELMTEHQNLGAKPTKRPENFREMAEYYRQRYLVPPVYVAGRKVAGLRAWRSSQSKIKPLIEYFGDFRLRAITYGDLLAYKLHRLQKPTAQILGPVMGNSFSRTYHEERCAYFHKVAKKNQRLFASAAEAEQAEYTLAGDCPSVRYARSVATVHRELALLHTILKTAVQERWLGVNPFAQGRSLMNPGDEGKRQRILSREEEARLLAVCVGQRAHLRPIILLGLDTGMRRNEMFRLTWGDVDFQNSVITVRAMNSKTGKERKVPVTNRVNHALDELYQRSLALVDKRRGDHKTLDNETVFSLTEVKRSFSTARRLAGIPELRLHDLRHTFCSRLVAGGLPQLEGARLSGHSQLQTFYRYVNADDDTLERAARILEQFQAAEPEQGREGQVN